MTNVMATKFEQQAEALGAFPNGGADRIDRRKIKAFVNRSPKRFSKDSTLLRVLSIQPLPKP